MTEQLLGKTFVLILFHLSRPLHRPSREGGALLRLRGVSGPLPHPLRPRDPDLLSYRLPAPQAAAGQETTTPYGLVRRFQRLGLGLGHHV